MTKKTKKDFFNQLLSNYNLTEEEVEFVNYEIDLLNKKNSGEKSLSPTQKENEGYKTVILDTLKGGQMLTITEMLKANEILGNLSNQRVSAIVRQLVADNLIVRVEDKRKAYFKLA